MVIVLQEVEEDIGIAPPGGRASYTAPSDVMADLPPNEQVSKRLMRGGRREGALIEKHVYLIVYVPCRLRSLLLILEDQRY